VCAALLFVFSVLCCTVIRTTSIYTLSLHDALPICGRNFQVGGMHGAMSFLSITASDLSDQLLKDFLGMDSSQVVTMHVRSEIHRSEEHTSELQSRFDLVCRLLLEKKKE